LGQARRAGGQSRLSRSSGILDWPQCERLLPQAQAAATWIERWDFAFAEGAALVE
jgi:hypothetical protein